MSACAGARLVVVIDACYSGRWARAARALGLANVAVQACCGENENPGLAAQSFLAAFVHEGFKQPKKWIADQGWHPKAYVGWGCKPAKADWTVTLDVGHKMELSNCKG